MLDLCCFGITASLNLLIVNEYPRANSGSPVSDIYKGVTPDAPIVSLLASHLGLDTGLVSNNIGQDILGIQILELLDQFNVVSNIKNIDKHTTPQSVVICDEYNTRTWFSYIPNVHHMLLDAELDILKSAKLAYIDLYKIIQKPSIKAIEFSSKNKIPLIINLGGDDLSEDTAAILRNANVIALQTGLDDSFDGDIKSFTKRMHELVSPQHTIVTLAEKGLVYINNDMLNPISIPAYKLQTNHSHGAGAAFSAGFSYSYLNDWDIEKSLKFSSALGGMFITDGEGFSKFTSSDVLRFIEQH